MLFRSEKRIGEVPGVESVTVNFAAGNATVRYDETRLDVADIKSGVRQRGNESDAPQATSSIEVMKASLHLMQRLRRLHRCPRPLHQKLPPLSLLGRPLQHQQPLDLQLLDRQFPHRHRPLQQPTKTRPTTGRA